MWENRLQTCSLGDYLSYYCGTHIRFILWRVLESSFCPSCGSSLFSVVGRWSRYAKGPLTVPFLMVMETLSSFPLWEPTISEHVCTRMFFCKCMQEKSGYIGTVCTRWLNMRWRILGHIPGRASHVFIQQCISDANSRFGPSSQVSMKYMPEDRGKWENLGAQKHKNLQALLDRGYGRTSERIQVKDG